jgi:hypothetical protein
MDGEFNLENAKNDATQPPHQGAAKSGSGVQNPAAGASTVTGIRSTRVKSLTELEKARFDAALLEPLEKRSEGRVTGMLNKPEKPSVELLFLTLGQRRTDLAQTYIPLPEPRSSTNPALGLFAWRIELCGLGPGIQPLGFDILDDVVIGRGRQADIDLGPYGASRCGMSRRHAMLRPTALNLHLIDLGSTNGTYYNSVPLGRAATRPIGHDDVITLGVLSFAIRIVDSPLDMARRLDNRS